MANLPTYGRNETTITARESDVALADFDGGMNLGASNAPGIGIGTAVANPKLDDWSVLDQAGAAREPQDSQHLGGDGLGDGDATVAPIQVVQGADINDEAHLIEATIAAAPGADAGGGVINRTSGTLEIGDRIWGVLPVA